MFRCVLFCFRGNVYNFSFCFFWWFAAGFGGVSSVWSWWLVFFGVSQKRLKTRDSQLAKDSITQISHKNNPDVQIKSNPIIETMENH